MSYRYNIYKLKVNKKEKLLNKLKDVGLVKQKSIDKNNYVLTFYFSDKLKGNPVWWYCVYKDFFNDDVIEPKNKFYFAILFIEQKNNDNNKYIVSLGKSHFYLNKLIVKDFGMNIAQRIANEETMSLKKSRLFGGNKRQEISSYVNFDIGSYEAGESIDHIKAKASDEKLWGNKNIIFSDSIQIDFECSPSDIVSIIRSFEHELANDAVLYLPKLEPVDSDVKLDLDELLLKQIKSNNANVSIEEFTSYGVEFLFNSLNYNYKIYYWDASKKNKIKEKLIEGGITTDDLSDYINKLNFEIEIEIENIKVKFKNSESTFTKSIKEIIDCHIDDDNGHYFLQSGEWYYFNECFMNNLKRSLSRIDFLIGPEFDELKYILWKNQKEDDLRNGIKRNNRLTYREYYFNKLQSKTDNYILLDRELQHIKSLNNNRKYSIEVADLYKNKTAWAVKIGLKKESLIYNIEQSKYSVELISKRVIESKYDIQDFGLWFASTEDITKITDINSIQFLLAIESWRRVVELSGGKPKFKYSKIINT